MLATRSVSKRAAVVSAVCGAALVAGAMFIPRVMENVHVYWPPLHGDWMPRFGPLSLLAIALGLLLWLVLPPLAARWPWRSLLVSAYAATWAWIMALAFVDGPLGLSRVFDRKGEYVYDAQRVTSIPHMLRTFVAHIPADAPDNWHTHVAGHPPGALLFFVLLDRLGITSHLWIGIIIVTLASSAVVAALVALRVMGNESLARAAAPWLVLAPSAICLGALTDLWGFGPRPFSGQPPSRDAVETAREAGGWTRLTVDGDALFTAVAAWGLCLLAIAAKTGRRSPAVAAGVLLGLSVYLSYGLVLLAVPAIAVLWICRAWRPLPWAIGGAVGIAALFTVAGFSWWEAYPVLVTRYYDGIASQRAYSYWVWGNLAAWTFTVGLATWAAFPAMAASIKRRNPLAIMAFGCLIAIVFADLSGMSKAEVERIWLPFTLWIVALPALLPRSWQRPLLLSQVVLALVVQHLVLTRW